MTGGEPVAIVGMACRYPDADDPAQLWASVLEQRQSFRRLPGERLNLGDYLDPDPAAPDKTYGSLAAVLEGWEFDRAAFRIPGSAYRAADPAHWLALETASRALTDAGYPEGEGLARDRVAVVVGNSLTGEVTRASTLRLRWPFVRETVAAAAEAAGLAEPDVRRLLAEAESRYLSAFEPVGDETLAGGLANTIAGRICNHFDFHGGGYTVDGACSSSLLAVITACRSLHDGSADVALAGGVDISLDPFELVGFAKAGALAKGPMRVYDERSAGFVPGEGCGMVVLMRAADAHARDLPVYAELRGWGLSSDGRGGLTRPERAGQLLALRRAYELAGVDPGDVRLIEGHGTGTVVGDEVELSALLELRRGAQAAAALGSVKANIGHTKAASGIAGLIKAGMSLATGVLPPITGCGTPHRLLREAGSTLRVAREAEPWPGGPRLAGVSSMGFGGINAHVVLGAPEPARVRAVDPALPPADPGAPRDCAPIVLSGPDRASVRAVLDRLASTAHRFSVAELHDLSCQLGRERAAGSVRVALVADTPAQLAERAALAADRLDRLRPGALDTAAGMFLGDTVAGRVTVLFPGQGAPVPVRLGSLERFLGGAQLPLAASDGVADTAIAQPAIHRASMAAARWLEHLGVAPAALVGHSLGEIAALARAGCLPADSADRLVVARGWVMSRFGQRGTGMASIGADAETVERLCAATGLAVAAYNGPESHVVAGRLEDLRGLVEEARRRGLSAVVLSVSHAFHSPAMGRCVTELKPSLQDVEFAPPAAHVVSTVLGRPVTADDDLTTVLSDQLTAPVRFADAVWHAVPGTDLFCEAGPGTSLAPLVASCCDTPVVSIDAGAPGERGQAATAAALFAAGALDTLRPAFEGRRGRPVDIWRERVFLANPCAGTGAVSGTEPDTVPEREQRAEEERDVGACVLRLLADQTELEPRLIDPDARLLGDLHLSSLGITQLLVAAADAAGRARPNAPLAAGDLSVAELVAAVEGLPAADDAPVAATVDGVAPWVRTLVDDRRRIIDPLPEAGGGWTEVFVAGDITEGGVFTEDATADSGVLVYVPDPADPAAARTLLAAARAAVTRGRLVAVTHGAGLSGFLRSLRQEHSDVGVTLLRVPATAAGLRDAARHAVAEPGQWREYLLDDGLVEVPVTRPRPAARGECRLGATDVLLVSGGGKGIGYACAAALAAEHGVALALLGRALPERDDALRRNLDALREAGVRFAYEAADVTDPAATAAAVARLSGQLGTVTAVLHAAGVNRPVRFADLDEDTMLAHRAPKVDGLRNLVAALDTERLRTLVAFGSVIGRYGLAGECHYALANGALRAEVERLAGELPHCATTTVDWSVWSGTGMGDDLGVLETLRMLDVHPIPVEEGVRAFLDLLSAPEPPPAVTVRGRLGALEGAPDRLPAGRSLDRVLVHSPGIELVAEAGLDLAEHPYLRDHAVDGVVLVPAVLGMELMAEAATAVAGRALRHLADLALDRPIVVPDPGSRTLRVCALLRDDAIDVVLRSDETNFAADHFRARFPLALPAEPGGLPDIPESTVDLDPGELYRQVCFHGPEFRLVREFTALTARHARVSLRERDSDGDYPVIGAALLLGDVTANDATVHALQACVPHRRLLPVGCERFTRVPGTHNAREIYATERSSGGGEYVWDVVVRDQYGKRALNWTGLRLRDVGPIARTEPWPEALLRVYIERIASALRAPGTETRGEPRWCRVPVAGQSEAVAGHDGLLRDLRARLGEPEESVAARVAAVLATAGDQAEGELVLEGVYDEGWAVFACGPLRVASTVVAVAGDDSESAVAVVLDGER